MPHRVSIVVRYVSLPASASWIFESLGKGRSRTFRPLVGDTEDSPPHSIFRRAADAAVNDGRVSVLLGRAFRFLLGNCCGNALASCSGFTGRGF